MPRGLRKRGKKHKTIPVAEYPKEQESYPDDAVEEHNYQPDQEQTDRPVPSWIIPAPSRSNDGAVNPEAPFGYVDAEVKAYFRTVDVQIRDWQESKAEREEAAGEENGLTDVDPNEERRLFFVAALSEMQGKEMQLATDPECSIVLERMAHSMDDFVRRVFVDSMASSYETLVRHRFASHVCQTMFTLAKDTIRREMRGIFPQPLDSKDTGELRTLTQLILDICEELLPSVPTLIMDPFASHVVRSLLVLLCPSLEKEEQSHSSLLRSKKSAAWKAKQGLMRSVFEKGKGKEMPQSSNASPEEFQDIARRFVQLLRSELDENEVRSMAANKVASPGLQMLLEVEADQGLSNEPGSLMDRVTVGIITAYSEGRTLSEPSDYLNTLFRDTTSSHLLEAVISRCPDQAFNAVWDLYLKGKLLRLAVHPVANFVVAKVFERTDQKQLSSVYQELQASWQKIIAASRSGVLRSAIDRAAKLAALGEEADQAVFSAFGLGTAEERLWLVPCALVLLPLEEYTKAKSERTEQGNPTRSQGKGKRHDDLMEPKIQGSLLLQSILQLSEPHNYIVTDSIKSLPMEERIAIAHHSVSSRVYDALLNSPSVSAKVKRACIVDFIGHYHQLADDRFGSHVADRCWEFADTYLKEKIARSLFQHEQILAGSVYGKYFSRNLNLFLLQRKPEQWRNLQSEKRKQLHDQNQPSLAILPGRTDPEHLSQARMKSALPQPREKRKRQEDEIDAVFNASLGKKSKKAALEDKSEPGPPASKESTKIPTEGVVDKELQDVLGALKAAPKSEKVKHKRRRD